MTQMLDSTLESGYRHPAYAASLAEFGNPCFLPASGGWVLERPIAGSTARDALGCYPLFACRNWECLSSDLAALGQRWVSLAVVADPFGAGEKVLRQAFPERVIPFKEHFVVDLDCPPGVFVSNHHRREARRAQRRLRVEVCPDPPAFLSTWVELYASLIKRHQIEGLRAFSRNAFARALSVPGVVALRAIAGDQTVGAHLWYVQGDTAYSHLAASTTKGYGLGAAYALHWFALEYFRGRVQWLNLGGGAGMAAHGSSDGLSAFKHGWATGTRTAFFCGRIFDPQRYAALVHERAVSPNGYFPAYRQGESL